MQSEEIKLNVLLVDDETEACQNLKTILLEYVDPNINIMGIAHSGEEAGKLVEQHKPDAVFLDIEMPNENAFQFLERVSPINFEVIFVTAYDEYAIQAFKLNAVDYILKPISISELANAVSKLKDRIRFKTVFNNNNANVYADLSKQMTTKAKASKITLKGNNSFEIVGFKDIIYVEANGAYSKVFFLKNQVPHDIFTSYSISDYEDLLPQDMFYRIHKSYLINCTHIKKINKDDSPHLTMYDKLSVPVSRRRFSTLLDFLKNNLYINE